MILSDRESKLALHRDHIRITPRPPGSAFASTSIDLTLHEEISFWSPRQDKADSPFVAYPARLEFSVARLLDEHGTRLILPAEGFVLKPGAFVLGWTAERIRLPHTSRLAARVEGRSSLARLGEVHGTPEKGYEGVFAAQAPAEVPPAPTASIATARKRRRR